MQWSKTYRLHGSLELFCDMQFCMGGGDEVGEEVGGRWGGGYRGKVHIGRKGGGGSGWEGARGVWRGKVQGGGGAIQPTCM